MKRPRFLKRLAIEGWCKGKYPLPLLPEYIFSRHLRRKAKYRGNDGKLIIVIRNGWYVHSSRNGERFLSVLPF